MTRENEDYLWNRLNRQVPGLEDGSQPRFVIAEMIERGMIANEKEAWATLEKWADLNWYTYGVALDLGWKTIDERPR